MMDATLYHIIVYVPMTHADAVRKALANAGAGRIGLYDSCSFSSHGVGRFRPLKGANPAVGTEGELETVDEERIEAVIPEDADPKKVLMAVRAVHPYEEPAIHLLPMADDKKFL